MSEPKEWRRQVTCEARRPHDVIEGCDERYMITTEDVIHTQGAAYFQCPVCLKLNQVSAHGWNPYTVPGDRKCPSSP